MQRLAPWILLFVFLQADAEIYRWVDEDGTTVYSQTPPTYGQANQIKAPKTASVDAAAVQQQLNEQTQKVDDYLEDRKLAQEKKNQEKQIKQARDNNCRTAKANLQSLSTTGRRLIREPDGSYVRLPEEQRQARLQKAQEQIEEYCQ